MSFLAPLAFLFALSIPAIIAFYLLKLRRTRREVASTLLWRRAAEDLQANAPFQKLRRNLLLLLQLIIAALVVLGLARPTMILRPEASRARVLVIDNSASMSAKDADGGRTRLEDAKQKAIETIRGMRAADQAMVVSFASKATVLTQFTDDRARLEQIIRNIAPSDLATRPADAFALAQSLARPAKAEVILFSDGAFSAIGITAAQGIPLRFVSVGKGSENVGIVGLDIRRAPERPKEFQVFATIRNYAAAGASEADPSLEVTNNGKLVDVRPLKVPAGERISSVFTSSQLAEGRVEIRLKNSKPDSLAADDSAYAVIRPPRTRRVLLVTAGNYFLERALRNVPGHRFEVTKVSPQQWSPDVKTDVTVFDGASTNRTLPPGAYLFLNGVPPVPGFVDGGVEEKPAIYDWNTRHPLMRFVELGDVQINRVRKIQLPGSSLSLAESRGGTPLISVFSAGNLDIVLWSFDLFETNLPLRVAFPILVSNSMDWLLRRAPGVESASSSTGGVLQLEVPATARSVRVVDPANQAWVLPPDATGRYLFDRTARAGFYRAEIDGKPGEEFGVSLADEAESDISPRAALNLDSGTVAAATSGVRANREIWTWLALAALAIVTLEWLIYHRRIWV